ncbi:MAG: hypothetical protein AB1352_03125 [Patescibacteria group bacterium]
MHAVISAFRTVFSRPRYVLLAVMTAYILLFIAAWVRNMRLVGMLLFSPQFGLGIKFKIFEWTFANLALNTAPLRFALFIAAAVLAGINLTLLLFYLRRRVAGGREVGASVAGILAAAFGVGCASCGSVLFTSLFGFFAGAATLAALPLRGAEFTLAGIGWLIVSIIMLAKKINDPLAC